MHNCVSCIQPFMVLLSRIDGFFCVFNKYCLSKNQAHRNFVQSVANNLSVKNHRLPANIDLRKI